MVLVDTSVWIDHFRHSNQRLSALLSEGIVICHPLVIGELACGNLKNRDEILELLEALPAAVLAEHAEVMRFITNHAIVGSGLGYIDAHLLASAVLSQAPLWTLDQRLETACTKVDLPPCR